jgi:hypothetical protein
LVKAQLIPDLVWNTERLNALLPFADRPPSSIIKVNLYSRMTMLGRIPLALVGLTVGGILTVVGFWAYATEQATLNLAGFFYGIPLLLGGLALKAAELKPIPLAVPTSPEIIALRDRQATPTQNQIRKDVTRYRYGQDAHLDDSLERLGLSPTDEERPLLVSLQETARDGAYTLILNFDSPFFDLGAWQERQEKIERFFGPGIKAAIAQPSENQIEVALIAIAQSAVPAVESV